MARGATKGGAKPEPAQGTGATPRAAPPGPKLRALIGGLGGITPFIVAIIVSDAATIDAYMSALIDPQQRAVLHLVGYLVKVPVFFLIGVLWAKLHHSEKNLLKIYQLGIVAPAIITGSIAASRLPSVTNRGPAPVVAIPSASPTGKDDGIVRSIDQNQSEPALSIGYVRANLQSPNAQGVAATQAVPRSPASTLSDTFQSLVNGFLARPPDQIIACPNVPVLAYVPNPSSVVIKEGKKSCQILVDFTESPDGLSAAECRDFEATLLSNRFAVSVADGNGVCVFRVSAR